MSKEIKDSRLAKTAKAAIIKHGIENYYVCRVEEMRLNT